MKKSEKLLAKKLKKDLPKDFDKKLWNRIDSLETNNTKSWFNFQLAGMAMAAMLVIVIGVNNFKQSGNYEQEVALENPMMLENLELLQDIDEKMMDLSDDEWEVLLAQS